ncbi:Heterokaryon incompatibility [Macrophomina phaseolina MS6]|uniref:Heterokaryon incompatibility n=1 Tax=Macrophomina phaseolina (strain MS6) TaxID=1126212 RepID=K2RI88_MACPH|nr:Heterokaryon incompatibility [Macrophomina phaseolina MS6]
MATRSKKPKGRARRKQAPASKGSSGEPSPALDDSRYLHDPLPDGEKFFRLLELLPGPENSTVSCRLRIHSINFHPDYDAISYVWGDERTDIFCHRKRLRIPRNLCDVLQRLRSQNATRILWADSICIDQSNLQERGHQVQMMRAIFRRAENVNAWLGRGDNFDARTAFGLVDHLHDLYLSETREKIKRMILGISEYEWMQLSQLLDSPWLFRTWTFQEVGLASQAFLLCGRHQLRWKNLLYLSGYFDKYFRSIFWRHGIYLHRISRMNLDFVHGKNEDVRNILGAAMNRACSNTRDKIYALLGHVAFQNFGGMAGGAPFVIVDYSKPAQDVFLDVAKRLLELHDPLYILSQIGHNTVLDCPRPPSWVPFWVSKKVAALADQPDLGYFYRACGSKISRLSIEDRILKVDGACLDLVKWRSDTFDFSKVDSRKGNAAIVRSIWEELTTAPERLQGSFRHLVSRLCSTLYAGWHSKLKQSNWTEGQIEDHIANFLAYLRQQGIVPHARDFLNREYRNGDWEQGLENAEVTLHFRCFFISQKGFCGLGPDVTQPGDNIVVFFGGQVPFILRPQNESEEYSLCGECYVDGMMYGEAIEMLEEGELEEQTFSLV